MEIAIDALFQYAFIFFFFFFLPVFLISAFANKNQKNYSKSSQLPPSPPALPIIGHLHLLSSILHLSLKKLAARYGPLMSIRVGRQTLLVVSNGAAAKQVFRTHDIKFAARPEFDAEVYKDAFFSTLDYGKHFIFLKKICVAEILSGQQNCRFGDVRREERMKLLLAFAKKSEGGEACDVGVELKASTRNLITRMTMSTRINAGDQGSSTAGIWEAVKGMAQIADLLSLGEAFRLLKKYDLFGAARKMNALLKRFDALMDGIILEHEKEEEQREMKDLMDILLSISQDGNAEVKLTKLGIKGLFLDLFAGGTDATSVAMQWAMAELLNNPSALKKLQNEIDTTVGLSRLVEESDIPYLPYLQAVVKESLRLHPSLPLVFRKCREDCKIDGYPIAKNSAIVVNLYAINRDPDVWENAGDFIPERHFLAKSLNANVAHDRDQEQINFSYVPFGGGRRGCPGTGLAKAVLHSTVAALVQCFDWKFEGAEKVNLEETPGMSAAMVHPLVCYPILRVDPSQVGIIN